MSHSTHNSTEKQVPSVVVDLPPLSRAKRERSATSAGIPPYNNMGVEFLKYGVHWVTLTLWVPLKDATQLYERNFAEVLGPLEDREHGGYGYRQSKAAMGGFRLLFGLKGDEQRVTMIFPGLACDAIIPEFWIDFNYQLQGIKHSYTRIDWAVDGAPFTPRDVFEAVQAGELRSLAKRDSLKWVSSPMQLREDGSGKGCDTCYLGSRTSERYLRVYNLHGPTRVELEFKGDRADLVANSIFSTLPGEWFQVAMGHVRDYVDFFCGWWEKFIGSINRAFAKVVNLREYTVSRILGWLQEQVSPTLATVAAINPNLIDWLIGLGSNKMSEGQRSLVSGFAGG